MWAACLQAQHWRERARWPTHKSSLAAKIRRTKPFAVSTFQEIEAAIKRLPREEFLKLHARQQRRCEDEWHLQMIADAKAGRLDHLAEEAIADYRAGGTKPFPPDDSRLALATSQ